MLDCFKKVRESNNKRKRAIAQEEIAAEAPPPRGMNATYYFKPGRFDIPEYYDDPLEDSRKEITKRVGGKRRVPRKDHKFEDRLNDIRRRIQRQQDLLASLEVKHKAAFPGAIHDADPGVDLRKKCYDANNALTGAEVIIFWQLPWPPSKQISMLGTTPGCPKLSLEDIRHRTRLKYRNLFLFFSFFFLYYYYFTPLEGVYWELEYY